MTGDEELTIVLADASVVVNLAIVDRMELLAALRDHHFFVPLEVIGEVERQRDVLDAALRAGHLQEIALTGISVLDHFRELAHDLGPGEAACLALASARGWAVASDERRRFRREALRLIGQERLLTTPDLFRMGIEHRYWTVSDADAAKEILERNRFRMRFRSFGDVMRKRGS